MKEVVVVNGVRTAIGAFGSGLKDIPVVQLGALVIKGVLKRSELRPLPSEKVLRYAPKPLQGKGVIDLEKKNHDWDDSLQGIQVDEVIMGNVLQSGQGQNTARQAMIRAGISKEAGAFTINKVCASGLKAVSLGVQAIQLDQAEVVIAGGMESMSNVPYSQYRTAILVGSPEQRKAAEASKAAIEQSKPFKAAIVTPVVDAGEFWPAEDYHQDYYQKNPVRYSYYRTGCGRDARLKQLWGERAGKLNGRVRTGPRSRERRRGSTTAAIPPFRRR